MSDTISVELEIINERGLHARAAASFVKTIDGLNADVQVERLGQVVDGNSIMGLMMLAAAKGTKLRFPPPEQTPKPPSPTLPNLSTADSAKIDDANARHPCRYSCCAFSRSANALRSFSLNLPEKRPQPCRIPSRGSQSTGTAQQDHHVDRTGNLRIFFPCHIPERQSCPARHH